MEDSTKEKSMEISSETSTQSPTLPTSTQDLEKPLPPTTATRPAFHPAVYVITWISLSSTIILFNKWIIVTLNFPYPVILTTWHLAFATIMTQILARTTTLLDDRKVVRMTGRIYLRAIFPIGIFFSLSLICGNMTYIHLTVAFIQMLKATTPVAVLLTSWAFGLSKPSLTMLFNVLVIVAGVVLASIGEIRFVLIGFLYQCGGIAFESVRLVMIQKLLNSADSKMDPLVSLYYFAPVCTVMNSMVALVWEVPRIQMKEISAVGMPIFFFNAVLAFVLNVSAVFLIGRTSSLVLTLCGVLKDILLIAASMLIWGTTVSPLQFVGYSIALVGLIVYKLGPENLKMHFNGALRSWSEYGTRRPLQRKLVVGLVLLGLLLLMLEGVPGVSRYAPSTWIADLEKAYIRIYKGNKSE